MSATLKPRYDRPSFRQFGKRMMPVYHDAAHRDLRKGRFPAHSESLKGILRSRLSICIGRHLVYDA